MFNDFKRTKIELTQINKPVGREPKIWHTDVSIEKFSEYLVDGNYSLPTKPVEKEFLKEVKSVEDKMNVGFEDTIAKLRKLNRTESEAKQNDDNGVWKEERKEFFTSTRTMFTEAGELTDTYYEVMANKIAKEFFKNHDLENYIAIKESMEMNAVEAMRRGSNEEENAREKLSKLFNENIEEHGMITIDGSLLGDSIDGSFATTKDLIVNDITIPKGSKVGIEIKNPKFSHYLNPNYMNRYRQQNQHHLFVGGYDCVITAKCFNDFDMILDVVYPNEKFFRTLLNGYDEKEKELLSSVSTFVDKYSLGF